jgi:phage-related protein
MAFDGSLKFDTKVDTSGFNEGNSTLKNAMEKLTSTIERLSDNIVKSFNGAGRAADDVGSSAGNAASQVDDIAKAAKNAQTETEALKEKMDSLSVDTSAKDINIPEEAEGSHPRGEFQDYGNEVQQFVDDYVANMGKATESTNEFKREIESLTGQLKQMESQGMYFGDEEYDNTFMKLAKVKQALTDYKKELQDPTEGPKIDSSTLEGQVDSLKRKLQQLSDQGKTFGDSLYDSTYQALNKAQTALNDYKKDLVKPVDIPVKFDPNSFEGQKQQLKAKLADLESKGISLGDSDYDSTYIALQRVIQAENEYKKSLLEADQGQKQAKKSADSMKNSMDKAGKSAKGAGKGMSMLGMLGRSILFSFVFRAINAVTTAVKEGFQNLAQYSGDVNNSLSSFMSSLLYLKNSFATAFAPVLDFVVPALNAMIDALASALAWIGQLIAALTGKGTFVKAVKTQEDYAASIKKTGAAAKQAGKDAQKSLAPFDQLNQLTDKNSSGTRGGGGASGTDPSQMFETVQIDSKISSIVDRMKKAFDSFLSWAQTNFGPSLAKVWDDMVPNIERFKAILAGIWTDLGTLGEPLKTWLNNDFVPFLQQVILTGGEIINGLFDSFNMVFSDIWNLAVFPALSNFITTGLPMITQFATRAVESFGILFKQVKDIFDRMWKDAVAPALSLVTKMWTDSVDSLAKVWDEFGAPIFDAINEAFEKTGDMMKKNWDSYIKPVFDTFMSVADKLWSDHLKPLMDKIVEFGARLIQVALDIYNGMILPLVNWFADLFGPSISNSIQSLIKKFGEFLSFVADVASGIMTALNGVLDFIHTGFTEGWDKAWSKVGDVFRGVFNGVIQMAENAINYIGDSLNSLSFDVPDWVPLVGGKNFGFDIGKVKLPRLATGTVVPPRAGEFAAILGDNNRDTEVVSPLGTIKQALIEALADAGGLGGGNITIPVYLDSVQIYQAMVQKNQQVTRNTGINPLME